MRFLSFILLVHWVSGAPTNSSSGTDSASPSYVAGPSGRGTVGLLTQCVVTLLLCVWTAIHLNIDSSGKWWKRYVKKIGWALTAMFAPELVLWRAWSQLVVAR